MRPPPVLIRRAIVDPLRLPVAAVLMLLLTLVAAVTALAWPLSRQPPPPALAWRCSRCSTYLPVPAG